MTERMPRARAYPSPKSSGFTLIEMLVVLAIVSILGGLILTGVQMAKKTSQINSTKTMFKLIESAMVAYETDFSDYPFSDGDGTGLRGAEYLYQSLKTEKHNGPYIELKDFRTVDSNHNGEMELADVWNQPILYWHHRDYDNAEPNKRTFRLLSNGPNRLMEDAARESDDVCNWDNTKTFEAPRHVARSNSGGGGGISKPGKLYELIVANGMGSGAYPAGAKVDLIATPQAGQRFGQWTVEEGKAAVLDSYASRTVLTMPEGNARVVAKFK